MLNLTTKQVVIKSEFNQLNLSEDSIVTNKSKGDRLFDWSCSSRDFQWRKNNNWICAAEWNKPPQWY